MSGPLESPGLTSAGTGGDSVQAADRDTISIWWSDLDVPNGRIEMVFGELSSDERERADRFVQPIHRNRFVAARAFLRRVMAQHLGLSPAAIRFEYGRNGKPRLGGNVGNEDIYFNVAHSGNRAVIAVSRRGEVGVDLEQICPKPNCLDIAERFFAEEERQGLRALDGEERLRAFYRCWTRKEAVVKAVGDGLSIRLDSFNVSVLPGDSMISMQQSFRATKDVALIDISPDPCYAATLAILNPPQPLSRVVQVRCSQNSNSPLQVIAAE